LYAEYARKTSLNAFQSLQNKFQNTSVGKIFCNATYFLFCYHTEHAVDFFAVNVLCKLFTYFVVSSHVCTWQFHTAVS